MIQDNSIVVREYLTTDKEAVMNLIKLNTPDFFAEEETNDLSNYLDKEGSAILSGIRGLK